MLLVIISQFTGLYYTFDEMNRYQRAPGFVLGCVIPLLILLLQISVIIQYYGNLRRGVRSALLLFTVACFATSIIQIVVYGISLNNITIAAMSALLYVFALYDMDYEIKRAREQEIEHYKEERSREHALFEQTSEALVSAIDAKDPYTNGHSRRVAEYSARIARIVGKSDEECENVYFAGLLHDVGKIGVPNSIINKDGRLTNEEYDLIRHHPVTGGQILSSIRQSPWLSIGARYHHELYGGGGYPEGLKGEEIPEIARIIAVADAYDAMASNRSYRNAVPQHIVREEIVKGIGTQFDPKFAKAMLHMIDLDTEYKMQERVSGEKASSRNSLRCDTIYHDCSAGFLITKATTRISFCSHPDGQIPKEESLPTIIVFDSLDGKVHPGEENNSNVLYFEYAQIRIDGRLTSYNTRNTEIHFLDKESDVEQSRLGDTDNEQRYRIETVRNRDHVLISVADVKRVYQVILALPDTSRFTYVSISGEHCDIHNIRTSCDYEQIDPDTIPRIAEEISYTRDCPVGDVPNLEVDGWRTDASEGIPIGDGLTLTFHTQSMPTARMVWQCPFISVFSSKNGQIKGDNFREYLLLRLDGENWDSDAHVSNDVKVTQEPSFEGWNFWKDGNKKGFDCAVRIMRENNAISIYTENLGISIHSVTTILDEVEDVYVALTGDQCVLTNICIYRNE
ncbi:MAG: HD-GYP domain-containing protein [Butyrivibrio sp.]|nr:HD-GYP domain-containing protein [Butyrivibrio sp.]